MFVFELTCLFNIIQETKTKALKSINFPAETDNSSTQKRECRVEALLSKRVSEYRTSGDRALQERLSKEGEWVKRCA